MSDLKETVVKYLAQHNIGTLATISGDQPWASTVEYVNDGTTLYFSSNPETSKIRNLTVNSKVAFTVDEDYPDWSKIKGLQISGTAALVTDEAEQQKAVNLYVQKYPFIVNFPPSPNKFYKIVPNTVVYNYLSLPGNGQTFLPSRV
ncbi:MAG: pyridoxamine 5'-phosphate oxidase family protein [Clostridia bacterium]|nr:pyridoxamine 5'-phosphate oxidase family protein [Clostridia bacterium]